nr:hypothetical protein CcurKRNrm2_p109 [Cryptomonas curvata]
MNLTDLYRTIFEKLLIKNPFKYNIWILYIYLEMNQGYINHAKKILSRSLPFIKTRNKLINKLYYFEKIFMPSHVSLFFLDKRLSLIVLKNFIFKNLNFFWIFQELNLFIYIFKNKCKNNFKSKKLGKLFDIETKIGRFENSNFFFEKLFFVKRNFFSIKLIINLFKRIINLVDKSRKLVILKNLALICNKNKNKIYFSKIKKILIENNILKNSLISIDYQTKKLDFLTSIRFSFFNSSLWYNRYLNLNFCVSMFETTNKFLIKISGDKNYFKIFKNNLYFFFSTLTYINRVRTQFKPLTFFINTITKDQVFLTKNIFVYFVFLNQINKFYIPEKYLKFFI